MPRAGMIYKLFKRQGCKLIRRDVVQGLEQVLQTPCSVLQLLEGSEEPRDAGEIAARVLGGLGPFTNDGKCLVMLVPGQLYWWKLTEHHSYLWELFSVLSEAVSKCVFLNERGCPRPALCNPSPP